MGLLSNLKCTKANWPRNEGGDPEATKIEIDLYFCLLWLQFNFTEDNRCLDIN